MGIYSNIGEVEDGMKTLTPPHELVNADGAPDLLVTPRCHRIAQTSTFSMGVTRVDLSDVSLTIASGEKLGIVGASGAGKSTLVAVLLRLYDAEQGRCLDRRTGPSRRDPRKRSHQYRNGDPRDGHV